MAIFEKRKLKKMYDELVHSKIGYLIKDHHITEQILNAADSPVETSQALTIMPCQPSAIQEAGKPEFMGLALALKEESVALAVCEEPPVLFIDFHAIRSLLSEEKHVKLFDQVKDWDLLLLALFHSGFRLAKVSLMGSGAEMKFFGK